MKKMWLIVIGGIIVASLIAVVVIKRGNSSTSTSVAPSNTSSTSTTVAGSSYDTQASQSLTGGHCSGTGSTQIVAPMKLDQIGSIQPYGLMTGGHVTPVDHQYYLGPDPHSLRDTYDVVAPAAGRIVNIQHRGSKTNTPLHSVNVPSSDEYRLVLAHSCSFLTYVDLVTSLDDSVKAKLPAGWTPENPSNVDIPVTQGQIIGRIGGQTLDFAVWDLSQKPLGFINRVAYDNAESWKVFTAPPSLFFTADTKAQVLAKYLRTAAPVDGKIDYDVEGKLIGTWFQVGTNGYEGGRNHGKQNYWIGHLAIAVNYIDPSLFEVSIGNYTTWPGATASIGSKMSDGSGALQFGIKGNAPDPSTIGVASGLVKYDLVAQEIHNADGTLWGGGPGPGVKVVNGTSVVAAILLQMTAAHALKVEVFPGKSAASISAFDTGAILYNRGDDATAPASTAH